MRNFLLVITWSIFLAACSSGSSSSSEGAGDDAPVVEACIVDQTLTAGQSCNINGQPLSVNAEGTQVSFSGLSAGEGLQLNGFVVERTDTAVPGTWTITSLP